MHTKRDKLILEIFSYAGICDETAASCAVGARDAPHTHVLYNTPGGNPKLDSCRADHPNEPTT